MNVLYVYDGDWPRGAIRVEKQTKSLARAGHSVRLVARSSTRATQPAEADWMTIDRLPRFPGRAFNRMLTFPVFVNPLWVWKIWQSARAHRADCIIVCDLPLALTAVWVGRWLNVPVHYDMAEVYPEFLRTLWAVDDMGWFDHIIRNPVAAEWLERRVLKRVEKVFVVSEESKTRLARLDVSPERAIVVGNTPNDVQELNTLHESPIDIRQWEGRPIVLFVGTLIADRGVVQAVEAMPRILTAVPSALLLVVGDGSDRARIADAVKRLKLENNVALLGWKEHGALVAYYQHAHVGVLPFLDCSHIRITLANKLFDYMGAGLPVVAVDVPPMRRILEETRAGLLFPPGDQDALAERIISLLQAPQLARSYGENGRRAVLSKYSWAVDELDFLSAIGP